MDKTLNTKAILVDTMSKEDLLKAYEKIEAELIERLVRLDHNNDIFDEVIIPTLEKGKKKATKPKKHEIDARIRGQRDQVEENKQAFASNMMALELIRNKIKSINK